MLKKLSLTLAIASTAMLAACQAPITNPIPSQSLAPGQSPSPSMAPGQSPPPNKGPANYVQMERLGRPAINEGLIVSNNLLNLWNAVPPSVDITPAAAPIASEATRTLMALGNSQVRITQLFTALLPDVMRIDTTKPSTYATLSPIKNIPVGGRLITDDVIDVTLSLIVPAGAPASLKSDGVSYAGPNANGNLPSGHKPVRSDFPYLADPN
jgi:hypothetical protein